MTSTSVCADAEVSSRPSRYTGKERDSESGNDYFSAPSNNNPFKEWPLNGNITPDTYQQDQKCSAGPVIGPAMDSLPGVKAACQWHDNKYIEYNCNATSWISPFPGPCKAINYMLLIKIYNAL